MEQFIVHLNCLLDVSSYQLNDLDEELQLAVVSLFVFRVVLQDVLEPFVRSSNHSLPKHTVNITVLFFRQPPVRTLRKQLEVRRNLQRRQPPNYLQNVRQLLNGRFFVRRFLAYLADDVETGRQQFLGGFPEQLNVFLAEIRGRLERFHQFLQGVHEKIKTERMVHVNGGVDDPLRQGDFLGVQTRLGDVLREKRLCLCAEGAAPPIRSDLRFEFMCKGSCRFGRE